MSVRLIIPKTLYHCSYVTVPLRAVLYRTTYPLGGRLRQALWGARECQGFVVPRHRLQEGAGQSVGSEVRSPRPVGAPVRVSNFVSGFTSHSHGHIATVICQCMCFFAGCPCYRSVPPPFGVAWFSLPSSVSKMFKCFSVVQVEFPFSGSFRFNVVHRSY